MDPEPEDSFSARFSPWLQCSDDGWSCTDPWSGNPFREAKASGAAASILPAPPSTPSRRPRPRSAETKSTSPTTTQIDFFEDEDPILTGFPDDDDGWPDPMAWSCSCGAKPFREAKATETGAGVAATAAEMEATPTSACRPRQLPRSVVVKSKSTSTPPTTPQKKELVGTEPSSISSPYHTDKRGDGSIDVHKRNGVASSRSPTSQFEYDTMIATHQTTLDLDSLHKNNLRSLLDEDKTTASKESSDEVAIQKKIEDNNRCSQFVQDILSPMDSVADFVFCRLECAFPEMVQDVNEILSNNLHHLFFQGEWEEKSGGDAKAGGGALMPPKLFDKTEDTQGKGKEVGQFKRGTEDQAHLVNTSYRYSPGAGLVRINGRLPKLSEEDVLIRVDATTISTRDCRERLRRDTNKALKDDVWVPGHAIVGHVVHAGMNAKSLVYKLVAALLPYGGGCSRYVCIYAKDVIPLPLPEETGCDEVLSVALLPAYMTAYQCLESVNLIADDAGQEQERSFLVGKKVLIFGAGTPEGLALVELARIAGAIVYTVSHTHSPLFCEMGTGYWYPFYQKKKWKKKWRGKMDLIVDTVGDSDYYPSFYKVMKTRGRLVRVNISSCKKKYEPLTGTRGNQMYGLLKSYKGRVINDKAIDYDIFHSFNDDKDLFTEDLAYLHGLLRIGKIRPKIFSRVGFDQLDGEWNKVMAGGTNGVVVVQPWK
jgi:NADPH2:quinone reductase